MPGRPTRRRLERRLQDLGADVDPADVPPLTVVEGLSYETEVVDADHGILRVVETGDLRRAPPRTDALAAAFRGEG
jgi:hypothetical protein